jgi:hypothetical protein
MDFNSYGYDKELAENGKRIELGENDDGTMAFLVICRYGTTKFFKRFNELTKPYGKEAASFGKFSQDSSISEDKQADIMRRLVAETVLIDWGGMTDEGQPLEYSVENAMMIFKKHESFLTDVIQQAQDDANFRAATMDAELGNSETDSEANSESVDGTEKP